MPHSTTWRCRYRLASKVGGRLPFDPSWQVASWSTLLGMVALIPQLPICARGVTITPQSRVPARRPQAVVGTPRRRVGDDRAAAVALVNEEPVGVHDRGRSMAAGHVA